MYQIQQTDVFAKWLSKLKDRRAAARMLARIESLRQGNAGDSKSLGVPACMNSGYILDQDIESISLVRLVLWFFSYVEEINRAKARISLALGIYCPNLERSNCHS
jgi:hypothetical protein